MRTVKNAINSIFQRIRNKLSHNVAPTEKILPNSDHHYVDARDCGLYDAFKSGWFLNETNELFKGFKISDQDIVVDFGCGSGGSTLFCARTGAHVTFIDSDANKISLVSEAIRNTSARSSEGITSSTLPLPIHDAFATRIIAQEVLEHVTHPDSYLRELIRIGKPGALYLLTVPHPTGELIQKEIAPKSHFSAPNHINIFETTEFRDLISNSGLEIIAHDQNGFFWSFWMMLYWVESANSGQTHSGATHDMIRPPYSDLLNQWASLWHTVIKTPNGLKLKESLDKLLPKSQIIIAKKPLQSTNEYENH